MPCLRGTLRRAAPVHAAKPFIEIRRGHSSLEQWKRAVIEFHQLRLAARAAPARFRSGGESLAVGPNIEPEAMRNKSE